MRLFVSGKWETANNIDAEFYPDFEVLLDINMPEIEDWSYVK